MPEEKKTKAPPEPRKAGKSVQKYIPVPRNKRTEKAMLDIFEFGTEYELMQYLRKNGLKDENPRFAKILKLFRERGPRRF
jgi:hypothetical protein